MKQAVMYGGGNIGRGFIGALLSQSGYRVTFIDVAEPVIKALQENKKYPIRIVSTEGYEDVWVENVTAVNGNLPEAVDAISNCDIMATAVGARILKFIVPNIVAGLRKRWEMNKGPLNIIICENLNDANKILEGMLKEQLTEEECKKFDETVFAGTAPGSGFDVLTNCTAVNIESTANSMTVYKNRPSRTTVSALIFQPFSETYCRSMGVLD